MSSRVYMCVCVCGENATHAAAYSLRVINGQDFFFSAEGC